MAKNDDKDNTDIVFSNDNLSFSDWGESVDSHSLLSLDIDSKLNLGVVAVKKLKWIDFVNQVSAVVTISSAIPKYNAFIGFLLLLSMNPIKALKLKDVVSKEFEQALFKNEEGYYLDLVRLLDVVDNIYVNNTVEWFCKNDIATLSEDGKKLMMNEYIVEFVHVM